jgi:hypothetical protein
LEEKKQTVIANEVAATKEKEDNLGTEVVKFSGTDVSALIEGLKIIDEYPEFKADKVRQKDAAIQKALILFYDAKDKKNVLGNHGNKKDGVDGNRG